MNTEQTTVTEASVVEDYSLDELEALMASFDDIEEAPEEVLLDADVLSITSIDEEIETSESDLAKAIKTIENMEIANAIYEEQESTDDHIEKGVKAVEIVKVAKVKASKVAKAPRATAVFASREEALSIKAKADYFLLESSDLTLDAEAQQAKHDEVLTLIKGMNVKIGAKCLNLLSSINAKSGMSTFIKSGARYILSADAITSADFMAYFMSQRRNGVKSYDKSTATPQSSTLLRLFSDLKMIEKDGASYKVNDNSLLIAEIKANSALIGITV